MWLILDDARLPRTDPLSGSLRALVTQVVRGREFLALCTIVVPIPFLDPLHSLWG
jgi:hypothetical protein